VKSDIGEKTDLSAQQPALAAELEKAVMAWNAELIPPLFQSPRPPGQVRKQPAKVMKKS
jgi:hypothetical protein